MKMIRLINVGYFLIGLILSSAVYAESISEVTKSRGSTTEDADIRIQGVVRNMAGQSLSNITVRMYTYDLNTNGSAYVWHRGNISTTDNKGRYTFVLYDYDQPKPHRLSFVDPEKLNFYEFFDSVTKIDDAIDLDIRLNHTTIMPDVILGDLLLDRSIEGRITDINNQGIEGVSVNVSYKASNNSWLSAGSTKTDANGNYSLNHLPENEYYLHARKLGYIGEYYDNTGQFDSIEEATAIQTELNENTQINMQLTKFGNISGIVKNQTGQPIKDVEIEVYINEQGGWHLFDHNDMFTSYYPINTDDNGYYNFKELPTGIFRLKFIKGDNFIFYKNSATNIEDATDIEVVLEQETQIDMVFDNFETATPDNSSGGSINLQDILLIFLLLLALNALNIIKPRNGKD